jgi:hypothetical protein
MAITYNERDVARIEAGGSIAEAVGGIAVGVLAIISLAATVPSAILTSIATIVLGIVLLAEGGTIVAEFSRLVGFKMEARPEGSLEVGGMTLELFAGVGLVVLGVLALIGIATDVLIACAVITAGAALVLRSGSLLEMSDLRNQTGEFPETHRRLAHVSAAGAVSIQVLAGFAAIVLGILALTNMRIDGLMFGDIGLLIMAAAVTLGSGIVSGAMFRMLMR